MSRTSRWWVLSVAGVAMTAACGQSSSSGSSAPDTAVPSRTAVPAAAPAGSAVSAPLTGLPWKEDPGTVDRGTVLAVLDDPGSGSVPAAAPNADLVLEELDGSQLRLLAAFQSDLPSAAPLGDLRLSDLQAIKMLSPGVLYSFAYPIVHQSLPGSGVVDLGQSTAAGPAYSGSGQANAAQAASLVRLPPTPMGAFPYAQPGESLASTGARPVGQATIAMGGLPSQTWTYDVHSDRWTLSSRGPTTAAVANVIVQFVSYRPTSRSHPDGSTILAPKVQGRGSCTAFAAGSSSPCQWYKPDDSSLTSFSDPAGAPLRFQRGPTWIVLVPTGTSVQEK